MDIIERSITQSRWRIWLRSPFLSPSTFFFQINSQQATFMRVSDDIRDRKVFFCLITWSAGASHNSLNWWKLPNLWCFDEVFFTIKLPNNFLQKRIKCYIKRLLGKIRTIRSAMRTRSKRSNLSLFSRMKKLFRAISLLNLVHVQSKKENCSIKHSLLTITIVLFIWKFPLWNILLQFLEINIFKLEYL